MNTINRFALVLVCFTFSLPVLAEELALDVLGLTVPTGFKVVQEAQSENTKFLILQKGEESIALYSQSGGSFDAKQVFASNSTVVTTNQADEGPLHWDLYEVRYKKPGGGQGNLVGYVAKYGGYTFYGYAKAGSIAAAKANAVEMMQTMRLQFRSLTASDYSGKKYYFGWGAAGSGDPSMMHNEVKYDVLHTHDIFTKEVGGEYVGTKMTGSVSANQIRNEWNRLKSLITPQDMYVQYSSGHGMPTGLGVGVNYNEIRDNALSYSAKEIIVLTMACNSGGLVNAFNSKKSVWQDWPSQGRTLFVMASSLVSENSSTGPGTDSDQPGSPNGSAGSAFGHALWKSLIGYADGYVDGVKDGFLSLEEIRDYTVKRTKEIGGHTPQYTGAYAGALVMNRVPPKRFLERLENGTEGLTDAEIQANIQALDQSMRVSGRD